jgi:hypothetical protein
VPGAAVNVAVALPEAVRSRRLALPATGLIVASSSVLAFAWAAGLLLARADGLATPAYDQAFFQQLVWRIGQDGTWATSFSPGSFLGLHFAPLLVAPALLERLVWQDARLLSVLYAVSIAALAPAAYLFLRAALRPSPLARAIAVGLAVPIPAWAVLQEAVRADFHPEVAGVGLALMAGWAALTDRRGWSWALAILALCAREDLSYAVACVGLASWALRRGRARRHGLALAAVAAVWGGAVFGVVMPWIRGGAPADTDAYYSWLGSGPGVLLAPLLRTDAVLAAINRPPGWFMAGGLLASLAGLPLLRPRWLLLLLPPMTAVLLSRQPPQAALQLQYPMILVGPAVVASAMGARRALALAGRRRRHHVRPPPLLAAGLAAPALAVALLQGAVPPFDTGDAAAFTRPPAIAELRAMAAMVPPDAPLAVDTGSAAPLADRRSLHVLRGSPALFIDAYVVLDAQAWAPNAAAAAARDTLALELRGEGRPVLADDGRFTLLGPVSTTARP